MPQPTNKKNQEIINSILKAFDKEVVGAEKDLMSLVLLEVIPTLQTDADGLLIANEYNYTKLNNIDKTLGKFTTVFTDKTLKPLAFEMLGMTTLSLNYFKKMGFKEATLDKIAKNLEFLHQRIGLDKKGKIIVGSYIDRLGKMQAVKDNIAAYINQSIAQKSGKTAFVKGFKELLETSKGHNGAMTKYMKTYVHDTIYQLKRSNDDYMAVQLGLNNAIYQGTIIDTTRGYCLSRVGKVFTRDEIASWKTLNYPYFPPNYDPFIDMGGYNCRHWYDWISDEYAAELKE